MEIGSFSPLASSSMPLEAIEAREFGTLMVSDGVECFSGEASAFSGFCHLGVPFDIFSAGSTLPTACSAKTASCPLEPSPSSEEVDVLEAELKLICDALMEDIDAGNAGLAEIGFGQDNSLRNMPRRAKKPSLEEGSAEQKCTDIAMVSIDLIQNKRPFKCSYFGCEKTFKNPQTLKMHSKTHCSDDVPLQPRSDSVPHACKAGQNKKIPCRCPVCGGTFVGLYELRRHFGRKHSEGEKMHCCKKCGKKFYVEVDLRDHLKLCGEPIGCKCGMKFALRCNLLAHKKLIQSACSCLLVADPILLMQRQLLKSLKSKFVHLVLSSECEMEVSLASFDSEKKEHYSGYFGVNGLLVQVRFNHVSSWLCSVTP